MTESCWPYILLGIHAHVAVALSLYISIVSFGGLIIATLVNTRLCFHSFLLLRLPFTFRLIARNFDYEVDFLQASLQILKFLSISCTRASCSYELAF